MGKPTPGRVLRKLPLNQLPYHTPINGTECVSQFHIFPPGSEHGYPCECGGDFLRHHRSDKQFIKARRWHEETGEAAQAEEALLGCDSQTQHALN